MDNEKIVTGILAVAIIAGVALLYFSLSETPVKKLENNSQNFGQFSAKEDPNDICAVPPGEDPVKWEEHLGHHPDRYAQCLK
ncbi:MAG: hypothetical protein HY544_02110 [Candidatus Diapherotrites archaeon]|uniref:Uncharacterized protein n=1 Tax=Candidatus Iainarchaeum sp. TaxID=3101447 RepID=A0A8T3YQ41_9ARCH|nr:hypothetical protein [Candidatus Diapherotrites archaeon]